jgi:hypothetical protein
MYKYASLVFLCLVFYQVTSIADSTSEEKRFIWRTVVRSDLIVIGTIGESVIRKEGKHKIRLFKVHVVEVLKGSVQGDIYIPYGLEDAQPVGGNPPPPLEPHFAAQMLGKRIMAFLEVVSDSSNGATDLIPLEDSYGRIGLADSPALEQAVKTEIGQEAAQISYLSKLQNSSSDDIGNQVTRAIDRLASSSEFQKKEGLETLLQLGCKSVPYIILDMNDHRPFHGNLVLANPPGVFEVVRQYAPKQMIDALSAILNDITGEDSRFISNGGSDNERQKEYEFWLIYLGHHFLKPNPDGQHDWIGNCHWAVSVPGS